VLFKYGLFHAIHQNFLEGVELILEKDKCTSLSIDRDHPLFQLGITPFILAASKNNYNILRILKKNGHSLDASLKVGLICFCAALL